MKLAVLGMVLGCCASCAPAAPPGGPVPGAIKVLLRYGRHPGERYRFAIHERAVFPRLTFERTLYVTEEGEDSLDARLVRVRIDSSQARAGVPAQVGVLPGFVGWFNHQRDRIDTLATSEEVEGVRGAVFAGVAPLPADSVTIGSTWTVGPRPLVLPVEIPDAAVHQRTAGVVKNIRVIEGDTLVDLSFTQSFNNTMKGPDVNRADVGGESKVEEVFSLRRGETISMRAQIRLDWSITVRTDFGVRTQSHIARGTYDKTILP